MSISEKRDIVNNYCEATACINCVLKDKSWETPVEGYTCLNIGCASEKELDRAIKLITGSNPENGGNNVDKTSVTISLERYDELIKKEAIYDELTKDKKFNIYLFQEVEDKENGK